MSVERKAARLEDPGAQLLDDLTSLWNRYGRVALIALGVIAVIAIGVVLTMRTRATAEQQAAEKLAESNLYFWQQRDYAHALQIANQVSGQWPNTASGVDALRVAGDSQFWLGDFKSAAAAYRRYLDHRKTGVVADGVRRSLAYALESAHQYAEAATTFEGLVGRLDRESSAEFLFAAARCERALNQPREAERLLGRLIDEYGETSYAERARILRAELAARPH
ncbi:MAG TPA: tetratricopeptide repeat protein [Terriglobales bacterium]|nr:tetratricopeptide repeat protein [Terriglobales bacterium]